MGSPSIAQAGVWGSHSANYSQFSSSFTPLAGVNVSYAWGGGSHSTDTDFIQYNAVGYYEEDNWLDYLNRAFFMYYENIPTGVAHTLQITYDISHELNGGGFVTVNDANLNYPGGYRFYERKTQQGFSNTINFATTASVNAGELVLYYITCHGDNNSNLPTLLSYSANETLLFNNWSGDYSDGNNGRVFVCTSQIPTATGVVSVSSNWDRPMRAAGHIVVIPGVHSGNQVIWCMSKIYDRIQENRKKLGIGDLGNFGQTNGLWKPKSGLVTI